MTAAQALSSRFVSHRVRATLVDTAVSYLCLVEYMSAGIGRAEATDHLQSLLEHLHDRGEPYDEVHVVAYSFGSVVAIDSLFPLHQVPSPSVASVRSLTTIGCPFDVFSALWPKHFQNRVRLDGAPAVWLNVAIESDPLASDFAQASLHFADGSGRAPDETVPGAAWDQVETPGVLSAIFALGQLRTHTQYWHPQVFAKSCFDPLVVRLFGQHPLLASARG
jgi:hypothetical protein